MNIFQTVFLSSAGRPLDNLLKMCFLRCVKTEKIVLKKDFQFKFSRRKFHPFIKNLTVLTDLLEKKFFSVIIYA
jgi:hypothetical protein